jgi:prefoldin subunit 5
MTYVRYRKETIDKVLEELESAIELADKAQARIERTLRESRQQREQRRAVLRRAGLLRD